MYIGGGFGCNPGAGRRSAGLGSEGAARTESHAVGVRAAIPVTLRDSARIFPWRDEGAICRGWGVHCGGEDRKNLIDCSTLFSQLI